MANTLDSNGLTIDTRNEISNNLRTQWSELFGGDVNFDSNTSDGQLLEIFAQMCADYSEVIREVYNSFFPNKIGSTVQDERYAINGIFRKEGSYTIQPIKITVDKTVTLIGLDQSAEPYTLQSDNGEQWYLLDTTTITTASPVQTLSFRAKEKGNVQPAIGTITSQVTVVQGVISVSNEVAPTSYGTEEGTDEAFAIRREQSVGNPSKNNITAIKGNILALDSVNQCEVYQYTPTYSGGALVTDDMGIPVGGTWVIVDGGDGYSIANTIYENSSNNILKGSVTENVLTVSGQQVSIKFDRPVAVPLYIKFNIQETVAGTTFDTDAIKDYIVENMTFKLGQYADAAYATDVVRQALLNTSLNGVATGVLISTDNSNWSEYIACPTVQSEFTVDATRIFITEINI
jgi:hypothetical protein